jgi:hypothetical protein
MPVNSQSHINFTEPKEISIFRRQAPIKRRLERRKIVAEKDDLG